ncbi:hypothetical protein QJQ45_029090 [Haematococcus lacustris]|nr:hypothetical protein QJQ45_029090 [Haematococcus lacustris]
MGQALVQALAAGHLQGRQPLQQPVGRHYPVCVCGVLQSATALAVLQRAAASQTAELEAATRRLADARQGAQEAEARAQQAEEERASSLASAAQSQAQVLALRRELAASGQQLAELAKEQARALQNLGGSDEALASATAQLQALRTQHQAAQQEVQQLHVRLGHLDTSCSTAQATVTALSHQLACLQADASSKRAVLAAIAQLGSLTATADGTRPGSKEGVIDAARLRPSSTQPGLAQQHASTHQGSSNGLTNGTGPGSGQDSGSDARQVPTGSVALALAGAGVRDSCVGSVAVSYYRVATTEAVMSLKVGDLPLHVLGPLACGVADSATLLQLTLDLELAAGQAGGVAGEEMALRCAVLAAGASLNTSLQQLSLTGFSWGGEGSGLAAPFLALGVPLAPPLAADTLAGPMAAHARDLFSPAMSTYSGTPGKAAEAAAKAQSVADGSSWGGSTSDLVAAAARLSSLGAAAGVGRVPGPHSWLILRPPALTCVQVDTRLVGTRCADSLAQLLLNGVVTLKKPRGQGLLRLYTDHEVMDEWYGELIQHAHDFPLSNLPPALLPSSKRISNSCGTSKLTEAGLQQLAQQHQSSQGGSSAGSQQLRHLAGNLYPRTTDSSSVTDSTYALGQAVPPSCSSALPPSRLPSHQPFPGMGDSTEPAQELSGHVAPIDCDLSNEGIESHHMCMVMAVLISCPHLRRLKLNGNSVGGAGVEIHVTHIRDAGVGVLARGLLHNSSLQELGLARNFITKEGARKLARALEANSSLRRLDLAGQRCPGALGPGGVEALAAALRNNTTLQELDIGGNDIRTQGAAALGSMLRAASSRGGALRRLSLCDNGLEASVLRVLQTAASEYKGLSLVLALPMLTPALPHAAHPTVQLNIWDPNLLPQIKAAMDMLTNASVLESLEPRHQTAAWHFVACNQSAEQLGQFLQDSTNSLLTECAAGSEPLRVNDSAFNISSAQYDVVLFPSNFLGDLGAAGALASLLPFIDGDVQQVLGVPTLEYPLLMYVNWPLLSYAYNLTRPVVGEAGQLSFYPDTWQELVAVMRHVNATASNPVTGKPRHALCIPAATDVSVVMYAVMASIMQTGGVTQGWLYDPMTLEPLTNNTAMQQVLSIMWDLSPFLRSFEAVQGELNSEIDLSKCAITLAGPSVFKTLHPIYSNRAYMGHLTMSPLPASTEVLDRSTMQLVPCTAQLCNNKRAAMLGGQLANLSPTRYMASELVGMTSKVPPQVQATAYGLLAFLGVTLCSGVAWVGESSRSASPPVLICHVPQAVMCDVCAHTQGAMQNPYVNSAPIRTSAACVFHCLHQPPLVCAVPGPADLLPGFSTSPTKLCCRPVLQVTRSAGSPADFAAAAHSMTAGLRAVRDSLGAAAFREQLWGTTGFVPPALPPAPAPSPPPMTGSHASNNSILAPAVAVPVGVCSLLVLLLAAITIRLRRNTKLHHSLLGHVLPPAAGDKATLVVTDVQGSSKLWETMPPGVMDAAMKLHDDLVSCRGRSAGKVRRLASDSSGYEWATEGDSHADMPAEVPAGAWSQQRDLPVRGMMWCPVVAPRKPPQAPRSSQAATQAAASEPGPSTPQPAKRSKRTKAEPEAAEPTKGKGKAAKAKPAPQPGRWLDRDCNAALNMQRIGESKWRPLELCYWPQQGALPAKGKEYPGLGYKQLRGKPPKAQQQQPAEAQYFLLCFHTPYTAVIFSTQLQEALLACCHWPAALLGSGSPSQPLYLLPAGLNPQAASVLDGHTAHGPLSGSAASAPASLHVPPHCAALLHADPVTQPGSPAKSGVDHEISLELLVDTPGNKVEGLRRQRTLELPQLAVNLSQTSAASLTASKPGSNLWLPTRQGSRSVASLRAVCSSSSNGRSKKKQDGAVEVGQGLLSLLAGQLWPELQSSVAASSTTLGEAKDGRMGHSGQLPLALPGAVAQAAHVSHVGWQRLCELYREVEVEEPGVLTVLVGLRVRVGLHTGLDADEVLVQSRMGASSTTYGGAALVLAKAVQVRRAHVQAWGRVAAVGKARQGGACAHGGQVTLSAATFVKGGRCVVLLLQLPVEELRAAGISVAHMGQHLVALGEGKGHTALNMYCAFLKTPAHAHRLWALGPLRVARQLQPGVLHAPHGTAATAFMSCHGLAQLKAWDASLAQECLALYQATAQRLLLHVAGLQLPAGYLVSTADEDGMVLAAFSSSLQCLHWALLTLTTCMDLDWPQALLDSVSGEEVVTERQSSTWSAASDSEGPTAMPLEAGAGGSACLTPGHCHTVRLLRGLRLKAGVDVGEVACDLTPANGRFNYRGRCLNRAARINGLALSGQVVAVPDSVSRCMAVEPSNVANQWQAFQQQLHGGGHADSCVGPSVTPAEGNSVKRTPGAPCSLCLPELLPPLVARPLGGRELHGIPGQVALLQVALAPFTSRAQLEAADRLGLTAPGLQLNQLTSLALDTEGKDNGWRRFSLPRHRNLYCLVLYTGLGSSNLAYCTTACSLAVARWCVDMRGHVNPSSTLADFFVLLSDASPIQLKNGSRANLDKLQEALTSEAAVAAWLEQQGPEWVDGALNMLPALADVLSVVVNVVVPPPGGQVLQIVLQVGAMLVSDQQNLAALASLGRDLSKLMALVLNADTLRALEVKKSTSIALEALQDVAKRIYEYIEETKDSKPWPIRLFRFALTRVEILELEQQLEKAKALLQFTSNLEVAAIVLNSEAQAEAAGAQVKQIMARRGLTEQQLAADPTALGEVAAALAGVGSMKLAVDGLMLGALKTVIQTNNHGPYRLVKNKVLSRLWQQYLVTELVTWKLFWQAFPDKVEPQHVKENLKKSLSDDRQKQAFRLGVDKCDKEVLSIDELNKAIPDVDETALPQVVMSITAQVRLGKSVNGIPPLPSTFVPRDDVATIAAMLQSAAPSQSNRTVVIHGWQGEGKRSTAQAVGHWMYEHVGVDSTYWVDLKHAGTKEDVQRLLLVGSGETLNPGSYREQLSLWLQHLSVRQPPAGLPTGSRLRAGPAHQPSPLLVVNDCEAAITAEARSELRRCLQEALDTVPGLRLVLAVQEGADVLTQLKFAVNNAKQASTGHSPFYLNYGRHPATPFYRDLKLTTDIPVATERAEVIRTALKQAQVAIEAAQQRQAATYDVGKVDQRFNPGQQVLLNTKNLRSGPHQKLLPRWLGPFTIIEHVGRNAVRLEIPPHMAIHPVFHVSLLRAYNSDGSVQPPSVEVPEVLINPTEPEVLPYIVAERKEVHYRKLRNKNKRYEKLFYRVRYPGFSEVHDQWLPSDRVPAESVSKYRSLDQLNSTPATYQLRQLPLAAAAQVLQNHLVSEGLKLSQADAELVAGNHGCNPRLLIKVVDCCKAYLEEGLSLDAVLRDMKSKRSSGDNDQALALISPLDDASRTALLVLSDTMPLEFDISMAKQVLGSSKQDSALEEARQLRVLQDSQLLVKGPGAVLSMAAVARTFALHLLQQEHQSFAASIKAAKQRLPDARQAMLGLLAEEVAKLHATYITSPRTVYAAMISKSPDIHVALRWLLEDGSLLTCNSTENVCHMDPTHTLDKVVTMLRHCCLGTALPWVLDPELVQRACKRLGQCSKGVAETQGTCHAVRAMYFKNDAADLKWGHGPALEQAELAVQATASCTEPAAQLAAALALRAKGLILREQGSYAAAIAAHYQALQLLEPLLTEQGVHTMSGNCSREVRLEQVLQLAELSGTLDYAGQHQEGYDQGCRAVRGAEQLLGRLPHPVTALALGALGYNCRMLGKLEEARENHSKALRMREEVLGRRHLETSMSLNQVALTRMDLAKQALARAVDGKGGGDEAHQRHARDLLVQAEMELKESLDIRKAGLGPHQPLVANTLRNLWQVQLLAAKGIPEASEAAAKRAKAMVVLAQEVEIRRARHQTQKINDIIKELRQLGCEEAAMALEKQVQ